MSTEQPQTKKPRTEKQKEASRANGARSCGAHSGQPQDPNTERYCRLAQVLLLPGESRKIFMTLADEFVQSLNPQTPIQHLLIGKMLAAHWRQNRLWGAGNSVTPTSLADENRLDRQFYRAYDRYFRQNKNSEPPNNPSDSFPDTYSPSGAPPEPGETRESEPQETVDPVSSDEQDAVAAESHQDDRTGRCLNPIYITADSGCGATEGILVEPTVEPTVEPIVESGEIAESGEIIPLCNRVLFCVALEDRRDCEGSVIVRVNPEIAQDLTAAIQAAGIERVGIRSVLTCESGCIPGNVPRSFRSATGADSSPKPADSTRFRRSPTPDPHSPISR